MDKKRYIRIDDVKIPVDEELYKEYYRPVWREANRKKARLKKEYSYEQMLENGRDIPSDDLVEDTVMHRLLLDKLHEALDKLPEDERMLIYALYFQDKSERKVGKEIGRSSVTVHRHKHKALDKLRNFLKKLKI